LKILSSLVTYWVALLITCSKYAPSNGVYKLNASYGITNFKAMVKLPKLVPSFSHNTRFYKMKPNFSSMTFNCLTNPSLIVSLVLKEPIVTWWSFQSTNRKFMTKAKISYYPLLIHRSNVIMLVNVASRWSYIYKSNYEESWLKGFFLTMSFEKGKQICPIKLQNQHMHPYILTSV
jgi:hypothetical protein